MAVRTKQLALGHVSASGAVDVAYTCPAGRTAIVKDAAMTNNNSGAVVCAMFVRNAAATEVGHLIGESVLAGTVVTAAGRFFVLEPGDELCVYASSIATGSVAYIASGTELDGVA